jgi:hypothetical protein
MDQKIYRGQKIAKLFDINCGWKYARATVGAHDLARMPCTQALGLCAKGAPVQCTPAVWADEACWLKARFG